MSRSRKALAAAAMAVAAGGGLLVTAAGTVPAYASPGAPAGADRRVWSLEPSLINPTTIRLATALPELSGVRLILLSLHLATTVPG
jgi:hypothetical protein